MPNTRLAVNISRFKTVLKTYVPPQMEGIIHSLIHSCMHPSIHPLGKYLARAYLAATIVWKVRNYPNERETTVIFMEHHCICVNCIQYITIPIDYVSEEYDIFRKPYTHSKIIRFQVDIKHATLDMWKLEIWRYPAKSKICQWTKLYSW